MGHYIQLMTLTPEGRSDALRDPENVTRVERTINVPDVSLLGLYGVLGGYDFVGILEAPDNEAAARYSLEFGVKAGVHITTLPAVPLAELTSREDSEPERRYGGAEAPSVGGEPEWLR